MCVLLVLYRYVTLETIKKKNELSNIIIENTVTSCSIRQLIYPEVMEERRLCCENINFEVVLNFYWSEVASTTSVQAPWLIFSREIQ